MSNDAEGQAKRDAAFIALGGHPGDWVIEYEIPPLRAIYHAFISTKMSEESARLEFKKACPLGTIRRLFKITADKAAKGAK